jgi:cytochrome c peroxidase
MPLEETAMNKILVFTLLVVAAAQMTAAEECCSIPSSSVMPPSPDDNPLSREKVRLGWLLFFDRRLSADESVSCASCHDPRFGFGDGASVSTGVFGQEGKRSAPALLNVGFRRFQFWDGRAVSLEEQALAPMVNPLEMGNTHEAIVARLSGIAGYRIEMARAFGSWEFTIREVAMAIAAFERTLVSTSSAFDRYQAGDRKALTASQEKGMRLFFGKANCSNCHSGDQFTDDSFHNLGIGTAEEQPDRGRTAVTGDPADWSSFKTPSLRDVGSTAPYMHNGSLRTLEAVVGFYDRGGTANRNLDRRMTPLGLSDEEKKDLVAFLRALSGHGWRCVQAPDAFPE